MVQSCSQEWPALLGGSANGEGGEAGWDEFMLLRLYAAEGECLSA